MKHKKIIGLLLLICIAVTCLGIVSATETIDGIEFNIPDGYKQTNKETYNPIQGIICTEYLFENGDKNISIAILVPEDSAMKIDANPSGSVQKTIKGHDGKYSQDTNSFQFEKGNKMIIISASDEKLEDIIV